MSLVSIGLPVFDGEAFLERAIESLVAQTHGDFELILADNASTDRTLEICEAWADRDSRIRVLHSDTNRGAAWNFNRTLDAARGPWFKWAAHDDICHPRFLQACLERLDDDPRLLAALPGTVEIFADERPRRALPSPSRMDAERPSERFASLVLERHVNATVFGVMRTDILRRTPAIAPYFGSDWVLMAELALMGPVVELSETLFWRREHPGTSQNAYGMSERLEWFDSRKGGRLNFPHWRMATELSRAVGRHSLSPAEAYRCRRTILRYVASRRRFFKGDLVAGAKHLVRRTGPGARSIEVVKRTLGRSASPTPDTLQPRADLPTPPSASEIRAAVGVAGESSA